MGFESPICIPNEISLEEIFYLKNNFDRITNQHVKEKIFGSTKNEIDNNMEFVLHLIQSKINMGNNWHNTIFKNLMFQKFYLNQKSFDSFTKYDQITSKVNEVYPLRLWDMNYDKTIGGYKFTTLQGEIIHIAGQQRTYWDFASGKMSIHEIATILTYHKPEMYNSTLREIIEFYMKMNDSFAMLFKIAPKYPN